MPVRGTAPGDKADAWLLEESARCAVPVRRRSGRPAGASPFLHLSNGKAAHSGPLARHRSDRFSRAPLQPSRGGNRRAGGGPLPVALALGPDGCPISYRTDLWTTVLPFLPPPLRADPASLRRR